MPDPEYRAYRENQEGRLKPYGPGPVVELDLVVRRLIMSAVQDVVTGALIVIAAMRQPSACSIGKSCADTGCTIAQRDRLIYDNGSWSSS